MTKKESNKIVGVLAFVYARLVFRGNELTEEGTKVKALLYELTNNQKYKKYE